MTDLDAIIAKLSVAQRNYLTIFAARSRPLIWADERWMTYPPANTHRVLQRLSLVGRSGQISAVGLAVRDRLLATQADNQDKGNV